MNEEMRLNISLVVGLIFGGGIYWFFSQFVSGAYLWVPTILTFLISLGAMNKTLEEMRSN